jgi:hypothetical protein
MRAFTKRKAAAATVRASDPASAEIGAADFLTKVKFAEGKGPRNPLQGP